MPEPNSLKQIRDLLMAEGLSESEAPDDPMDLLRSWLEFAQEIGFHNANAMTVSTVNQQMEPSSRNVLLRGQVNGGLIFYTNYESSKGSDLDHNNKAAALIGWLEIERQIRVTGHVERTSAEVSDQYFSSRERGSQISAVVSKQSQPVSNRAELEQAWDQLDKDLEGRSPDRPAYWGGYSLFVDTIEFWQGRHHRLHDRMHYRKTENGWKVRRLAP
jgi:pyridoxamine 5'-phosphate oxidase